ncbi:1-phosphatidylinositol 4,5-bisphosphate phosphodiesterase classes I and II [Anabrus simplex]|uniref:1-phosphatidylinositol 4,5-bisphosphate phosphodiesterase classes I and II n=1 Tax=Anabrus simplex TaxID=316456 RepID=UPI0035A37799
MAGTKNTAHVVQLKPVDVPKSLQDGEKFIKWDEDSGVGVPVTLRVDKNGFFLYWVDQNKELDMLDIATIRDTRTGKHAKIPKDPKLRQIVTMGSQDTLEEKTVTVCFGSDFVNLSFINFCCTKKEIAQLWTDELLKMAYNILQINSSTIKFLQKAHTKLTLQTDKTGKIPIKNIIKLFTQNREDRKRVEKALDISGLPSGKNDSVSLQKFQFEDFFNFYKSLTHRSEVEKIFEELCGTSKRRLMSSAQFVEFLNKTQRDPRLNEILYPYANTCRAKDLIQQYEPNKYNAQRGQFSFDGFLRYLMSEDNPIMSYSKFDLSDDMDQPLPHYFINSSHNTYLTGHQLTGKSAVEMYRQCLLAGCRCVELDFWNGRTEEPVIVHGYTFVPEISAREVIEAIAESAFKTSDCPVILSFENHCNPRQQAKIAQYCRDIFGDMLLDSPLDSHKLEPGQHLPPPSFLKRKIIIKNKKKHHHHHHKKSASNSQSSLQQPQENIGDLVQGNGDIPHPPALQTRQGSKESNQDDDENEEDDESSSAEEGEEEGAEDMKLRMHEKSPTDKVSAAQETEAGAEISALVNYVQPVHFVSFENSEKKNRYYEMSSFDEKQATTLLKESPIEFVKYNKHQLSRVYPAGFRFDSSNFMPQVFWNAGCQLVALNYQTLDLAMQLNLGMFEYNHRCGYILKPEFMRRRDRRLDPFAESTVDGIIAGTVSVHVISGQFLTDKRVGTYVEVDMYGLPADTVRKKFRTKIIPNNAINPIFDEEPFVFKKVVLPELASIRLAAYEESGRLIGHRVLPVVGLCPGYRHVALRTEAGQPLLMASVFLHIVVKDYVPDGLSDFAEALANPIKYQSELEKRAQQLAVLTDDMDVMEEDANKVSSKRVQSSCSEFGSGNINPASVSPGPRSSIVVTSPDMESVQEAESSNSPPVAVTATTSGELVVPPVVVNKQIPSVTPNTISNELVAEPLEKLMENKVVKEKKLELEKKLESLRKKHDKEKSRVQMSKGSQDEKSRSKFYMSSHKLVKRLSSKNIELPLSVPPNETSECSECEGDAVKHGLPRSQSERLLAVCKEHVTQERELQEKYHEMVFSTVEKLMRSSQSNQLKMLRALLERETADVMRKLQAMRREEVKQLSKIHKDKDEMVRIKREVASSMVEKGVHERVRLTEIYEKKREELERQHEEVRVIFEEEKNKARALLLREYEGRYAKVEQDLQLMSLGAAANTDALG